MSDSRVHCPACHGEIELLKRKAGLRIPRHTYVQYGYADKSRVLPCPASGHLLEAAKAPETEKAREQMKLC